MAVITTAEGQTGAEAIGPEVWGYCSQISSACVGVASLPPFSSLQQDLEKISAEEFLRRVRDGLRQGDDEDEDTLQDSSGENETNEDMQKTEDKKESFIGKYIKTFLSHLSLPENLQALFLKDYKVSTSLVKEFAIDPSKRLFLGKKNIPPEVYSEIAFFDLEDFDRINMRTLIHLIRLMENSLLDNFSVHIVAYSNQNYQSGNIDSEGKVMRGATVIKDSMNNPVVVLMLPRDLIETGNLEEEIEDLNFNYNSPYVPKTMGEYLSWLFFHEEAHLLQINGAIEEFGRDEAVKKIRETAKDSTISEIYGMIYREGFLESDELDTRNFSFTRGYTKYEKNPRNPTRFSVSYTDPEIGKKIRFSYSRQGWLPPELYNQEDIYPRLKEKPYIPSIYFLINQDHERFPELWAWYRLMKQKNISEQEISSVIPPKILSSLILPSIEELKRHKEKEEIKTAYSTGDIIYSATRREQDVEIDEESFYIAKGFVERANLRTRNAETLFGDKVAQPENTPEVFILHLLRIIGNELPENEEYQKILPELAPKLSDRIKNNTIACFEQSIILSLALNFAGYDNEMLVFSYEKNGKTVYHRVVRVTIDGKSFIIDPTLNLKLMEEKDYFSQVKKDFGDFVFIDLKENVREDIS